MRGFLVLRFNVPPDALVVALLPLLFDPRQDTIDMPLRTAQSRRWLGEPLFVGLFGKILVHYSPPVVLDVYRISEPPAVASTRPHPGGAVIT